MTVLYATPSGDERHADSSTEFIIDAKRHTVQFWDSTGLLCATPCGPSKINLKRWIPTEGKTVQEWAKAAANLVGDRFGLRTFLARHTTDTFVFQFFI